ncbi:MAG TPA: serine protease, partial [Brevundimonas sp.]|nr:serine protease [Brevundimonas sp.]
HVVADATEIKVKMSDGRELPARLVGRDESTDLAVIKVDGGRFPYVSFEESAEPRVGDWVIAVGNPFGLGGTATG